VFFCKKVELSSTQGALCTVSVFFISHFTYLGVRMHPAPPPCLRACLVKKFTFSRMQQTTACLHFACRTTPCVSGRAARRSCLPGLRRGSGGGRQAGAAVLSCLAWRCELALRCGAQVTQPFFDLPTHVKRTAAGQGWGGVTATGLTSRSPYVPADERTSWLKNV